MRALHGLRVDATVADQQGDSVAFKSCMLGIAQRRRQRIGLFKQAEAHGCLEGAASCSLVFRVARQLLLPATQCGRPVALFRQRSRGLGDGQRASESEQKRQKSESLLTHLASSLRFFARG